MLALRQNKALLSFCNSRAFSSTATGIKRVLISNRGEIACRIHRTCQRLGIDSVAVYTEPDAGSLHVRQATTAVSLGPETSSYVDAKKILEVAKSTGSEAIHPGYGFLSENPAFATACEQQGIAFLGPTSDAMKAFSFKHTARELAKKANVPIVPGSPLLKNVEDAQKAAEELGYPVMLKATAGGGGIGMHVCTDAKSVKDNFERVKRQGAAFFKDDGIYLEKMIVNARHIEVQIFGDGHGNVVHLGERECSIQRRNQKVIEESPSPFVTPELREQLTSSAVRLGKVANYRSAGTVEFIVDDDTGKFYFLEVNTRLQVEHGVTEMCNNVDLVEWMIRQGAASMGKGKGPDLNSWVHRPRGHAIEARVYAEDPCRNFLPTPGTLTQVEFASSVPGSRFDTWVQSGTTITPHYDPLIAKVMAYGPTRNESIRRVTAALRESKLNGMTNNLDYLAKIIAHPKFRSGNFTTKFLSTFPYERAETIEVVMPGMLTTVQDYPGRKQNWRVGIPPSGPMDDYSFRLANALVGNGEDAAAFECTLQGPTIKLNKDTLIALTGAKMTATLSHPGEADRQVPYHQSVFVKKGSTLSLGTIEGPGVRTYLAISGGVGGNVPVYLGSRATFPDGNLGGVQGRALKTGDCVDTLAPSPSTPATKASEGRTTPQSMVPQLTSAWRIGVLPGPQAAPDYFTNDDMKMLYSTDWKVHYNSNRLGIRLLGPRPKFARKDGGEGGSHPSNLHDNEYAVGTVNFTGDMPIILTVDGPSLGGFACPITIPTTEFWKLGQLKANDTVRFTEHTIDDTFNARVQRDSELDKLRARATTQPSGPYFHTSGAIYRLQGDRYVLVEYGDMVLDLNYRFRVHALEEWLNSQKIAGLIETAPGVRSLQIEYDNRLLPLKDLLDILRAGELELPNTDAMRVQSRVLHLPMAFNEKWTHESIGRYMKSFRDDAPYLPSNVEFVVKNNGLKDVASLKKLVFDASYLIMGLGDVYLGAPCAVPIDPRHRLSVPKYNPARTFTPEGAVGLGGAYSGYQLVGRSLPIWSTFGNTSQYFNPKKPWLLEMFDQVRFFELNEDELMKQRSAFSSGSLKLKVENEVLEAKKLNEKYSKPEVVAEVKAQRARQAAAQAEQLRLDAESIKRLNAKQETKDAAAQKAAASRAIPAGAAQFYADFTANVWDIKVKEGDEVKQGDLMVVLESMKMEYQIRATRSGRVHSVNAEPKQLVHQGDVLVVVN